MIVVFDLDDTLFDELSFVRSGFKAVAAYIEQRYGIETEITVGLCENRLALGRGGIFDAVFRELGIFSNSLIVRCVRLYRSHEPNIKLYPAAGRCLERLAAYPMYIVTDGNKTAQLGKLQALRLYHQPPIKRCFLTYRHGIKRAAKPSPYCFKLIAESEMVSPKRVVYIADNPAKDFVGIKPHGFKTVRVRTGQHHAADCDPAHAAHVEINGLGELDTEMLRDLCEKEAI